MTATTFLTGQAVVRAPGPLLVATPRLTVRDGLRLLRTPSSEAGVQAYHRALEGEPVAPQVLLNELTALREGRSTRFELLAEIATSPEARARGVSGPGLLLLRAVRKAFVVSGFAARIRAGRMAISDAQDAAASSMAMGSTPGDVSRKLALLEGALLRLENRVFSQSRASEADALSALEDRVAALEAELKVRILDLRSPTRASD